MHSDIHGASLKRKAADEGDPDLPDHVKAKKSHVDRQPQKQQSGEDGVENTSDSSILESHNSSVMRVIESEGDIFDASSTATVAHACNCKGSWGAGIAKAFKEHYPDAYSIYHKHCVKYGNSLAGKALLIPPQRANDPFVGCLFTSQAYGRKKATPAAILKATQPAVCDLLEKIANFKQEGKFTVDTAASKLNLDKDQAAASSSDSKEISELRICKINSGLFAVPWAETKKALEAIKPEPGYLREIKVISRPE